VSFVSVAVESGGNLIAHYSNFLAFVGYNYLISQSLSPIYLRLKAIKSKISF